MSLWTSNKKQESSVRHLQTLFSVVAGGSLLIAVEELVPDDGMPEQSVFPLFVAFLLTAVPLYHGGMRHVDDVYLDESSNAPHQMALFWDFWLLFVEGGFLLALATSVDEIDRYPYILLLILLLDAFWAISTYVAFAERGQRWSAWLGLFTSRARALRTNLTWALINICTSLVLVVFLIASSSAGGLSTVRGTAAFILLLSLARTAIDYRLSWKFYFPPVQHSAEN